MEHVEPRDAHRHRRHEGKEDSPEPGPLLGGQADVVPTEPAQRVVREEQVQRSGGQGRQADQDGHPPDQAQHQEGQTEQQQTQPLQPEQLGQQPGPV